MRTERSTRHNGRLAAFEQVDGVTPARMTKPERTFPHLPVPSRFQNRTCYIERCAVLAEHRSRRVSALGRGALQVGTAAIAAAS